MSSSHLRRAAPRGWWLMMVLATGVAGYGLSFSWRGIDAFGTELLASFYQRPWAIWLHFMFGPVALIARALNFRHAIRRWMIRSYAMILAAVTLRIHLPILAAYFQGFEPAYQIVAWSCWVPNLLVAELVVRMTPHAA